MGPLVLVGVVVAGLLPTGIFGVDQSARGPLVTTGTKMYILLSVGVSN